MKDFDDLFHVLSAYRALSRRRHDILSARFTHDGMPARYKDMTSLLFHAHHALMRLCQRRARGVKSLCVASHLFKFWNKVYYLRAAFWPGFQAPFSDSVQHRDML